LESIFFCLCLELSGKQDRVDDPEAQALTKLFFEKNLKDQKKL
jgi:hypothetical protein